MESRQTNSVWWAFRPVGHATVPTIAPHPVDAFIEQRLRDAGIRPNGPATRRQLIRRATLDLTGLPPSADEIATFESDLRPDAWEQLIDRLLERPEYGERWARHWLDVVRFAQSNGYERDSEKPFAWRYRDYVVRSLNADKPYDRFVREHIAGDLLEPFSGDAVIATGFARLGVLDDEPDDKQMAVFDELDDVLSTTGVAFLGLTLGCARCHEHKFDPISHADYYRLLAFFRGVEPAQHMADPAKSTAHLSLNGPGQLQEWRDSQERRIRELEQLVGKASDAEDKKRRQVALDAARKEQPPFDVALGMRERPGGPEPTFVLKRGNSRTPGEAVTAGFPSVIGELGASGPAGSHRRLLADWMASADNPLTARVIVNRVWHYHFGRGLVRTTGDFGRAGELPSHPELLDWLSADFIRHGWSLKRLHRRIMTSEAYRRSSGAGGGGAGSPETIDPGNELLWRQNLRRLEAEAVRDSILAVSGELNRRQGGRGFFPRLSAEVLAGGSRPGTDWEISPVDELSRRSLYAYVRRSQPVPILESLDYANYSSPLTERPVTTVAPQALLLLNDDFMHAQACALAARVQSDVRGKQMVNAPWHDRVVAAYRRVLGRSPTPHEQEVSAAFLDRQRSDFGTLRSRLSFRADVPATMNVSYFDQLRPENFFSAPAGWSVHRGSWPDSYEGNRTLQRGNGPFALWPRNRWTEAEIRGELVLSKALEGGGILFGNATPEGRFQGYELSLDTRNARLQLLRHSGTNFVVAASASAGLAADGSVAFRVRLDSGRIQAWLGTATGPTLDAERQPAAEEWQLGCRAWGAALIMDRLQVDAPDALTRIDPAPTDSDPERRALEAYCLLLLNLNELVYLD